MLLKTFRAITLLLFSAAVLLILNNIKNDFVVSVPPEIVASRKITEITEIVEISKKTTTAPAVSEEGIKTKQARPSAIFSPKPPPIPTIPLPTTSEAPVKTPSTPLKPIPTSPQLNENEIMAATVRIRCGKTFGSGFVLKKNEKWYALTAAHVIIDKIEARDFECDVIFPYYNPNFEYYQEAHYRVGKILSPTETEKNYKEKGFDLAVLEVLPLENKSEDARVFPAGYPFINYPLCSATNLTDKIVLWGYATNIGTTASPGSILSQFEGEIVQYGDIKGVLKERSNKFAGGYEYLADLNYTADSSIQHPAVLIMSNNNFSGASGGLVFDISKNCVIGVNVAVSIQDNQVFGLVINPSFAPIKDWFETVIK